ncbi:MAG: hypothetical protein ACHQ49_09065 [Elusimicrobiota bacterium]
MIPMLIFGDRAAPRDPICSLLGIAGGALVLTGIWRIENPRPEAFDWIALNQAGERVYRGGLEFIKDYEAAAAQKGIGVLLSVDAYSSSHQWAVFFDEADLAKLLAECARVSPSLSVEPRILKRLGA